MVQKVKDRLINSFIMIATGVVVSLISVSYANSKSDAKEFEKEVDKKLDKTEFIEFKIDNEADHEKIRKEQQSAIRDIKNHFDTRFEDMKGYIKLLKED